MGAFGERMQREREMRSISLEEIAESTKISSRMLRALEEEDFEKLPGGIFNKGFVRAYSKYLGLDEEQAVTDFMAAIAESQRKKTEANVAAGVEPSSRPDRVSNIYQAAALTPANASAFDLARGLRVAIVLLLLLAGLGGLGYFLWTRLHLSESTPPPRQSAPAKSAVAQPTSASAVPAANAATLPAVTAPNPASKNDATGSVSTPAQDPAADTATQAAASGPFNVRLEARQLSWVYISVDGKNLSQELLQPHTSREFTAKKEMVVKLGNAPGVAVLFNGKALPAAPPGAKTQTLAFDPSGLKQ